jgi:flagellar basal body-associated protein FliL
MAEQEKPKEQPPPPAEAAEAHAGAEQPKKGKSFVTFGIFGGVMVVEGIAIFLGMRFLGSHPDPTVGVEGLQVATQPAVEAQEFDVANLRVLNRNGPRAVLYSVRVVITASSAKKEKVEEFLKNRKSTIEDAMSQVLRSAEEKYLAEPGLETLRRQLRHELNQLMKDEETIEQVLIPEFTPLPTGY